MLLESLRKQVLEANLELVRSGLVVHTFGNASGISRADGLVAIKPSGVDYSELTPADIVITSLDGRIVDGDLRPSSDLETHLVLYREFPEIGGVVHTHSEFATAWAQARKPIPCFGTTHADYFHGPVPVTEELSSQEIGGEYEKNTGLVIARLFANLDPSAMSAVLVAGHAPFVWGKDALAAAHNAAILEYVARMAYHTVTLASGCPPISKNLLDKHYLRKHGSAAYYGQGKRS